DSRVESRKRNFRCLTDVRWIPDAEPFSFAFNENTSDLQPGDSVLIHSGNISSTPVFHGVVRALGTEQIRVSIPIKNLAPMVFAGQLWIIDRFPTDVTAEASHTALYDYLMSPRTLPTSRGDAGRHAHVEDLETLPLNRSQIRAIERS